MIPWGKIENVERAVKIIAQKKRAAHEAGISLVEWMTAEEIISRIGGAQAWIDFRDFDPIQLSRAALITEMPVLAGTTGEVLEATSARLNKVVNDIEDVFPSTRDRADRETAIRTAIRGITEVSAKKWIEKPIRYLIQQEA